MNANTNTHTNSTKINGNTLDYDISQPRQGVVRKATRHQRQTKNN